MNNKRIYLSPPNLSDKELSEVTKVFESGWVAPVGPAIDEFEKELSGRFEDKEVLALNSGTSALHLALILAGVKNGDDVVVSSFTFAACANVVLYERATPVFLDSEEGSWNLDPDLLEEYLSKAEKKPKAVIVTHLYGMPADMRRIMSISNTYGVRVIEDAAEALGSTLDGRQVGSFGDYGVVSFNGNKIITTSAGGALVCRSQDRERGKHLASQANSGSFGYDHKEVGFNYRMSNVLAGIGLAQLVRLEAFVKRKREIFKVYKDELGDFLAFPEEHNDYFSNRWLTTGLLKNEGLSVLELIEYLDTESIETRQLWKPLHLHKGYEHAEFYGTGICEKVFNSGICLPSGTGLTEGQQQYVIEKVKARVG